MSWVLFAQVAMLVPWTTFWIAVARGAGKH